ncbi:hypothetical protein PF003_g10037 [Phytophthora fragariae]|nr:hypothetical protein PF003_g10037 [Phytophthora fragariae]
MAESPLNHTRRRISVSLVLLIDRLTAIGLSIYCVQQDPGSTSCTALTSSRAAFGSCEGRRTAPREARRLRCAHFAVTLRVTKRNQVTQRVVMRVRL